MTHRRVPFRPALLALALVLGMPAPASAQLPQIAASIRGGDVPVSGKVTGVRDGSTVEVGGVSVRFTDVACGPTDRRAAQFLARVLEDRTLRCEVSMRRAEGGLPGTCRTATGVPVSGLLRQAGLCRTGARAIILPVSRVRVRRP